MTFDSCVRSGEVSFYTRGMGISYYEIKLVRNMENEIFDLETIANRRYLTVEQERYYGKVHNILERTGKRIDFTERESIQEDGSFLSETSVKIVDCVSGELFVNYFFGFKTLIVIIN